MFHQPTARKHRAVEEIATKFPIDYAKLNSMQTNTNLLWFNNLRVELGRFFESCRTKHPTQPVRILELGCGAGIFAYELAKAFPTVEVLAVDISEALITGAKQQYQQPNLSYAVRDATKLEKYNDHDLILGLFIMHFIQDKPEFMRRVAHSLRPGGQARFITPLENKIMLQARQSVLEKSPWKEKNNNRFCIAGIATDCTPYQLLLESNSKRLAQSSCEQKSQNIEMSPDVFKSFLNGIALEIRALELSEETKQYCSDVCDEIPKRQEGKIDFKLDYTEIIAIRRQFEPSNDSSLSPTQSRSLSPLCPHRITENSPRST